MLEIRPSCEHCDKDLPADSGEAMICSYECTFCSTCVDDILENVCPNCGGGFEKRPIRPETEWRTGVSRTHQPPKQSRTHKPLDPAVHKRLAREITAVPAVKR